MPNDFLYTTAVCRQSEDVYFSDCLYSTWLPDLGCLVSKAACFWGLSLSSFVGISVFPCLCVCVCVLWVIGFDLLVCKPPVRYMIIDSNHSWHTCVPACLSMWVCVHRQKYSISPELTFSYFILCILCIFGFYRLWICYFFARIFLPAAAFMFFCSQPRGGLLLPNPSHALEQSALIIYIKWNHIFIVDIQSNRSLSVMFWGQLRDRKISLRWLCMMTSVG